MDRLSQLYRFTFVLTVRFCHVISPPILPGKAVPVVVCSSCAPNIGLLIMWTGQVRQQGKMDPGGQVSTTEQARDYWSIG